MNATMFVGLVDGTYREATPDEVFQAADGHLEHTFGDEERVARESHKTGVLVALCARALQGACHQASVDAGWWGKPALVGPGHSFLPEDVVEVRDGSKLGKLLATQKLMLTVSELSEAMEGLRKDLQDDKLPERKMFEVELADAVIRIGDLAGAMGFDLGGAIAEKMAFNEVRPDHKAENRAAVGGKAF